MKVDLKILSSALLVTIDESVSPPALCRLPFLCIPTLIVLELSLFNNPLRGGGNNSLWFSLELPVVGDVGRHFAYHLLEKHFSPLLNLFHFAFLLLS